MFHRTKSLGSFFTGSSAVHKAAKPHAGKRYKRSLQLLAVLLFPLLLSAQKASLILTNGKIFTADTAQLYVEAIAIRGNTILATGRDAAIRKWATSTTQVIDLQGKTVVPGFNDAHDHLAWLVPGKNAFINAFSVPGPSKQDLLDSMRLLTARARPGEWLYGTIGLTAFNDSSCRRAWLDSLAPNNPVVLFAMWGHGAIVNSAALQSMNISDTAADPLGGWYERRNASGKITGALYEYAQFPFWQAVNLADPANIIQHMQAYDKEQQHFGITSVQNMSSTLQADAAESFFAKAKPSIRTRIIAVPATTPRGRLTRQWQRTFRSLPPLTRVSGVKYIIDGTSLERTALKSKPYPGTPQYYGRLNFPIDTIKNILSEALGSQQQLMLHITGDSATRVVLQLMKSLATAEAWRKKRVRIEHGNGITSTMAADVKNLGIIIVHTPQYGRNNPIASWIKMGIPVAIGPDALTNPFINLRMLTSEQADPLQNLTMEQAVTAYTKTNAFAELEETKKGMLKAGQWADLTVLSQDIFTIPAAALAATRSLMTMVNGVVLFKSF